jgi:hypothetical protein
MTKAVEEGVPYGWSQVVGRVTNKQKADVFAADIHLTRDIKQAELLFLIFRLAYKIPLEYPRINSSRFLR